MPEAGHLHWAQVSLLHAYTWLCHMMCDAWSSHGVAGTAPGSASWLLGRHTGCCASLNHSNRRPLLCKGGVPCCQAVMQCRGAAPARHLVGMQQRGWVVCITCLAQAHHSRQQLAIDYPFGLRICFDMGSNVRCAHASMTGYWAGGWDFIRCICRLLTGKTVGFMSTSRQVSSHNPNHNNIITNCVRRLHNRCYRHISKCI
jgi:hypothetical protein